MSAVRTFTCILLESEIRDALGEWQKQLRSKYAGDFRWVTPVNLHITLTFLGDVPREQIARISETLRLSTAGSEPLDLEISSAGAFPRADRPRVLWAGVGRGRESLVRIQDRVAGSLETEYGFEPERRQYHPHITVARARGRRGGPSITEDLAGVSGRVWGNQRLRSVHLMKSALGPGGPVYTILDEIRLGE